MKRRVLVALGALSVLSGRLLFAQARMPRIGFLGAASASGFARQIAGLRAGLKELGYIEGKNISIEFRWAEGKLDRLPGLAAELVRAPVDVIVTQGVPATRAAKAATSAVPIVIAATGDAVGTGLVASLARPGGNITGLTFFALELAQKRLELLKRAVPQVKRVAVMFNPDNPIQQEPLRKAMETAAAALNVQLEWAPGRSPKEFEDAVSAVAGKHVDAVIFNEEPMQLVSAAALTEAALKNRLASTGPLEFAERGAVIAYGVDVPDLYRRSAYFVDKILKGVKPGELPIEQATRFLLVVNLRAANQLGLSIPAPLVQRADRVIE